MQLKSCVLPLLALVSLAAASPSWPADYEEGDINSFQDLVPQGADTMIYDPEYAEFEEATDHGDHGHGHRRRGPFSIVPVKSANKCLDVRNANFNNGTPVQIFDCNGTNAQKWIVHRHSGQIRVAGTNFCLDAGHAPRSGIGLKIWTCLNVPQQSWRYRRGDKTIKLRGTNLCADLSRGSLENGSQSQTFTCVRGERNQFWRLRD